MAEPTHSNRSIGDLLRLTEGARAAGRMVEEQRARAEQLARLPMPEAETARAARRTAEEAARTNGLLGDLLAGNAAQDAREQKLLRWTVVGVILSGVAALTGVVALIVALAN